MKGLPLTSFAADSMFPIDEGEVVAEEIDNPLIQCVGVQEEDIKLLRAFSSVSSSGLPLCPFGISL
jgi:hypothetical protein